MWAPGARHVLRASRCPQRPTFPIGKSWRRRVWSTSSWGVRQTSAGADWWGAYRLIRSIRDSPVSEDDAVAMFDAGRAASNNSDTWDQEDLRR